MTKIEKQIDDAFESAANRFYTLNNNTSENTPIVCIMNGPGGNGKDTFCTLATTSDMGSKYNHNKSFSHISIVRPVKEIINKLVPYDELLGKCKEYKTDSYRQLLHSVFIAWKELNPYGPVEVLIDRINKFTSMNGINYGMIFIDIREPSDMEKLVRLLPNKGVTYMSIYIDGLHDASEYKNDCDSNVTVDGFDYDIVIHNKKGDLDTLQRYADYFAKKVMEFNPCT